MGLADAVPAAVTSEHELDGPGATIGRTLKRLRRQRGLSLDRLSERSGVSRAMLSQVEHGQSMPTITTLSRVAKGLGVPVGQLLTPEQAPVVLLRAKDAAWSTPTPGARVRELSRPEARAGLRWFEFQLEGSQPTPLSYVEPGDFVNLVVERGRVEFRQAHTPAFTLEKADASAFVVSEPASLVAREPSTLFVVVVRASSPGE